MIFGICVHHAGSLDDLDRALCDADPDFVLLDWRGIGDTAPLILAELEERDGVLPVLVMVDAEDRESTWRAYAAGAREFISKPVSSAILPYRIQALLQSSSVQNELLDNRGVLDEVQKVAHVGSWQWNRDQGIVECSRELANILGVSSIGEKPDWTWFLDRIVQEDRDLVAEVMEQSFEDGEGFDIEYRILRGDGAVRIVQNRGEVATTRGGIIQKINGTMLDVTSRRSADKTIRELAFYDRLTGLPNRHLSRDRLELAIREAERNEGIVGLLFFDVDQFKRINGSMSPAAGDSLLEEVARRLQHSIRGGDSVAHPVSEQRTTGVSRLGGDEFTILLRDIAAPEDTAGVAKRILHSLELPFCIEGREIFITASIGVACYPFDADCADSLMERAIAAHSFAKGHGGSNYKFFDPSMDSVASRSLLLESGLHRALANDEFFLCFQPKVLSESGKICGMEALIRWKHPELGLVSPVEFIGVAEDAGLISDIGEWVLRTACRFNRELQDAGMPHIPVAVNVSSRQFRDPGLDQLILEILEESKLRPECLELEITESTMLSEPEAATNVLTRLRAAGVRVALDDFGTGYSSLGYVKDFPLDTIKIDRSFVAEMHVKSQDSAIVRAIVAMAHSLGMRVVAEGVEEQAHVSLASEFGCDELQGFFFSPPVQAEEFSTLLKHPPF